MRNTFYLHKRPQFVEMLEDVWRQVVEARLSPRGVLSRHAGGVGLLVGGGEDV